MIRYELQKLLSPMRITMIFLLLIAKCVISCIPYSYDISYSKAVYREYMRQLEGQTAAQAAEWIATESEWIEQSLNAEITDDMTVPEQMAATENLAEAQRKVDAFAAVYNKYLSFCEQSDGSCCGDRTEEQIGSIFFDDNIDSCLDAVSTLYAFTGMDLKLMYRIFRQRASAFL